MVNMGKRQIPTERSITKEKDYCDLLYAWIQCNSERVSPTSSQRRIRKSETKFVNIEKAMTRKIGMEEEKIMSKYTISKYFKKLVEWNMIYEKPDDKEYYYLQVLDAESASLIEYNTLVTLTNVLRRYAVTVYVYLYNRYFANQKTSYNLVLSDIKKYIGISTNTASNNGIIVDIFDILQRLGLLSYKLIWDGEKSQYQVNWVKNELPNYDWE